MLLQKADQKVHPSASHTGGVQPGQDGRNISHSGFKSSKQS